MAILELVEEATWDVVPALGRPVHAPRGDPTEQLGLNESSDSEGLLGRELSAHGSEHNIESLESVLSRLTPTTVFDRRGDSLNELLVWHVASSHHNGLKDQLWYLLYSNF